jgi:hypothetical protein
MDYRQPAWMSPHLEQHNFQVCVKNLSAGDFAWSCPLGRVGVEDKPLTALLTDRASGRLDDELRRCVETYAIPILLVRGWPRIQKSGELWFPPHQQKYHKNWNLTNLDNLLFGRQLHGVYVTWCYTDRSLGGRLASLYEYTQQPQVSPSTRPSFLSWREPLTGKALVFYTILGMVKGIRNRRTIAEYLAGFPFDAVLTLWDEEDLHGAGLSKLMARRVHQIMAELRA